MSRRTKTLDWLTRLLLVAFIASAMGGCQDYLARRDTIAFHAGEAAAYNKAIHVVDPWPAASADADIPYSGKRMVDAIERYEAPKPAAGGAAPTLMAVPLGPPAGAPPAAP